MIPLNKALRLGAAPQVALVGAGGKTSAMFALARQFSVPVLLTTTTHLAAEQVSAADQHLKVASAQEIAALDAASLPPITLVTGIGEKDNKVTSPGDQVLQTLSDFARQHSLPLFIEADGARQGAFKAPAEYEPAIPAFVDCVVVVAGLSALGQPLATPQVHRAERVAQLSGLALNDALTPAAMAAVLRHPEGGLKGIPPTARKVALLNQADTPELQAAASSLAARLLPAFDAVLVAALQQSPEALAVHERMAGILLAAGSSERLGTPKQLLDWKGKPFVRHIAETGLAAGLEPLVVVTGANAPEVEAALKGLPVTLVHNEQWPSGQSSSVKAGLAALPAAVGGAVFLVVDQPQLPAALIETLLAEHAASLAPIVATMVEDHRSNPVLFDRSTFPDFAALQGDVGGRAVFSKHAVTWLPWLDSSLAIDVDSPEDYDRLLRQAG